MRTPLPRHVLVGAGWDVGAPHRLTGAPGQRHSAGAARPGPARPFAGFEVDRVGRGHGRLLGPHELRPRLRHGENGQHTG